MVICATNPAASSASTSWPGSTADATRVAARAAAAAISRASASARSWTARAAIMAASTAVDSRDLTAPISRSLPSCRACSKAPTGLVPERMIEP